ncbi:hypothetical protein J3F84DRAFT_376473 [Trichoderma pleuroticola]
MTVVTMPAIADQYEKPLILVAHPRSRSTAFERVFIQHQAHVDVLHEPFGDPYWLGSERQLGRYEELRNLSGYSESTYKNTTERISQCLKTSQSQGKRLFIKEMAFFMFPAQGNPAALSSSFGPLPSEPRNPTLLPRSELAKFQFTFLIRHPYLSVPSYYRLSLPGEKEASCVKQVTTSDLGYSELRQLFDYLREEGLIGQSPVTKPNGNGNLKENGNGFHKSHDDICVIDSEELLENPGKVMSAYCKNVGIPYKESLLSWDNAKDQKRAAAVIDRWKFPVTFHKDVLQSTSLSSHKKLEDGEKMYQKWVDEFGIEGANEIREAANSQMDDYEYLKQFVQTKHYGA